MKKVLFLFFFIWMVYACTDPAEKISPSPGSALRLSADTVLFDTVFTSVGSITKRVRIYNDNPDAVRIDRLALAGGSDSPYRFALNGVYGSAFTDQVLLGEDSLQLLVEVTIDPADDNLPFIVSDSILINSPGAPPPVKLISWGQDANFLNDSILACDAVWTGDRPYVIFNSVLVDSTCTLTIEEGARVYNHFGSSIFVAGSLLVEGTKEAQVLFTNDRLDPGFSEAPGQWDGIYFLEGSRDNQIRHAEIRNSRYGIWLGTPDADTIPDLVLSESIIHNVSRTGLIAFTSDLEASNVLIYDAAEYCVGNFAGGNYRYVHCTFANYPFVFFREQPLAVFTDNLLLGDNSTLVDDIKVELVQSVLWGTLENELVLNNGGGADFTFLATNNILKTNISDLGINGNLLNENPRFVAPEEMDYRLAEGSPAIDLGNLDLLPADLDGNPRDAAPDAGCYEKTE